VSRNMLIYLLKARTVEPEETAVVRELHGKHVSMVMNTHNRETVETVSTMWSTPRPYNSGITSLKLVRVAPVPGEYK
jgi:hypothetical protein